MQKINPKKILFLSVISFLLGAFLNYSESDSVGESGAAIAYFSVIVFLLSLTMTFMEIKVFQSWLNFARVYLLIAFVLIILAPATGETGMGFSVGIDHESITWTMVVIFLLTSIILIVRENVKLRRSKQTTPSSPVTPNK
ncbi:MAG: hypothetical protein WC659_01860 [Patescibacteria group bacterium]